MTNLIATAVEIWFMKVYWQKQHWVSQLWVLEYTLKLISDVEAGMDYNLGSDSGGR